MSLLSPNLTSLLSLLSCPSGCVLLNPQIFPAASKKGRRSSELKNLRVVEPKIQDDRRNRCKSGLLDGLRAISGDITVHGN